MSTVVLTATVHVTTDLYCYGRRLCNPLPESKKVVSYSPGLVAIGVKLSLSDTILAKSVCSAMPLASTWQQVVPYCTISHDLPKSTFRMTHITKINEYAQRRQRSISHVIKTCEGCTYSAQVTHPARKDLDRTDGLSLEEFWVAIHLA